MKVHKCAFCGRAHIGDGSGDYPATSCPSCGCYKFDYVESYLEAPKSIAHFASGLGMDDDELDGQENH